MFHVSFRYIFGIPPLILVLLPVASSDCEIKGKDGQDYKNILRVSFDYLLPERLLSKYSWIKQWKLGLKLEGESEDLVDKIKECLSLLKKKKNNVTHNGSNCLNNESNFFKKHSCDDNKEAMFLFRAARKLKLFVRKNITEDFDLHLLKISQGTIKLLNCTNKVKDRKSSSHGEGQPTRNLEENKQKCLLITLLDKIQTCWNKVFAEQKGH